MKIIKIIILLGIVNGGVSIDEASVVAKNFIHSKNNHIINDFYIDEKKGIDNFYIFNVCSKKTVPINKLVKLISDKVKTKPLLSIKSTS